MKSHPLDAIKLLPLQVRNTHKPITTKTTSKQLFSNMILIYISLKIFEIRSPNIRKLTRTVVLLVTYTGSVKLIA